MRADQCNVASRLTGLMQHGKMIAFPYNGDGVRVGKTVGAATTDYLVDLAATLSVVISDTDAIYLYGLDIIAEQLAGADRYYYVHDGLGSVRQLLDSTGQIATRYAYDPFGVPLAGNGVANPWQFTGEAWDAQVELLYLRARYYQPGTGRFITKDPWRGDLWRPGTLNRYVYVVENPVNDTDPTGISAWAGEGPPPLCPECHPPPPVDPLTSEQWELSKQEAAIFQIPVELVAGTIAVEIVHDTQWHDPVLDVVLATGLGAHWWGQLDVLQEPGSRCYFAIVDRLVAGYEHYWGFGEGRGPGPGVANFHIGTAKMVEQYFAEEYPDWRVLEQPTDIYERMLILLSDPASIHYTAAYLRHLADLRKGTGVQPLKTPHTHDLTDLDMQVICGAFRAGVGKGKGYEDVTHFQEATTPGVEFGPLIRPFLSFYRRKLALEYGRVLRYM